MLFKIFICLDTSKGMIDYNWQALSKSTLGCSTLFICLRYFYDSYIPFIIQVSYILYILFVRFVEIMFTKNMYSQERQMKDCSSINGYKENKEDMAKVLWAALLTHVLWWSFPYSYLSHDVLYIHLMNIWIKVCVVLWQLLL